MQDAIKVLVLFLSVLKKGSPGALAWQGDQKKSEETEKRANKKSLDSLFSQNHYILVYFCFFYGA